MRICPDRGKLQRIISIQKSVLRTCRHAHIIPRKLYRTLGYSTPSWLDDIFVVTRGNRHDLEHKLFDILNELEKNRLPSK